MAGTERIKNTKYHGRKWAIFVSCDNSGFVDDDKFSGDVWEAGRYTYTSADNAAITVPKYTANPEDVTKR